MKETITLEHVEGGMKVKCKKSKKKWFAKQIKKQVGGYGIDLFGNSDFMSIPILKNGKG